MNKTVSTLKDAYIEVCKFACNEVNNDELLNKFKTFLSLKEFKNEKQSGIQKKDVYYKSRKYGNINIKTAFSNEAYAKYIAILIDELGNNVTYKVNETGIILTFPNKKVVNPTLSQAEITEICKKSYEEWKSSPFADKIDYPTWLDISIYKSVNG